MSGNKHLNVILAFLKNAFVIIIKGSNVQDGPNVLLHPCRINATHNVKYVCFKKLSLLYFLTSYLICET